MAISDEISRLQNAKSALKTSIEGKGVTVSQSAKLEDYPALVDSIQAGGGSSDDYEYKSFTIYNDGDVFEAPLMQKNCLIEVLNGSLFGALSFVCRNSSKSKSFSYTLGGGERAYFLCHKISTTVTVLKAKSTISIT